MFHKDICILRVTCGIRQSGAHGKKRLGGGVEDGGGDQKGKTQHTLCIYCEPGTVFRAVYFIFGIVYEVGTADRTIFFR